MTNKGIRVFIYSDDGNNNLCLRPSICKYDVLKITIQNDLFRLIEGPFWDCCSKIPKCALKYDPSSGRAYLLLWNIPSARKDAMGRKITSSVILEFFNNVEAAFSIIHKSYTEGLLDIDSSFVKWVDETFENDEISDRYNFDEISPFFKAAIFSPKSLKLTLSGNGKDKFLFKINNRELLSKKIVIVSADYIDSALYEYYNSCNDVCIFLSAQWIDKDPLNNSLLGAGSKAFNSLKFFENNAALDLSKLECELIRVREGSGETFVCINGFLCQNMLDEKYWITPIVNKNKDPDIYILKWESKKLEDIGNYFMKIGMKQLVKKIIARSIGGGWILFIDLFNDFIKFPWFQALAASKFVVEKFSKELLISGKNLENITLLGHSLGARIVHGTLNKLHDMNARVKEAYLFGAAISGADEDDSWKKAYGGVKREIYNYHSQNDYVLKFLYSLGTADVLSSAAGVDGARSRNINNRNVSDIIKSHTEYKENLIKLI